MRFFSITAALVAALAAFPAAAQDYSAGSQAQEWPVFGAEKAKFEAKVVDIVCELTGECAETCGDGFRHMGLVRSDDDKLILVSKNRQPIFSGGSFDLAPYCNETVEVDGLLVGDPEITPGLGEAKLYILQFIKRPGDAEWTRTNLWSKEWAARNPEAAGKGPWFRRDPAVLAEIEANGYLGLGAEADAKFAEENF